MDTGLVLGCELKALRQRHHISRQKLAAHCLVNEQTVALWERGASRPNEVNQHRLRAFLLPYCKGEAVYCKGDALRLAREKLAELDAQEEEKERKQEQPRTLTIVPAPTSLPTPDVHQLAIRLSEQLNMARECLHRAEATQALLASAITTRQIA